MSVKEQFAGSWRLVSSEFRRSDGTVTYPLGKDAKGLLIYDINGYMSAQLLSVHRPKFASGDHLKGTPKELKAIFEGCMTYYGTFEIDEAKRLVNHSVAGSSVPNWEGQVFKRYYEFSEGGLILSTPEMKMGGGRVKGVLIWKRASPV